MSPVVPTGALAPGGMPAAAGGVDVAGALTSVVPGIRKLKKIAVQAAIPKNGGRVQLDLPKSSYMSRATIRITGELQIEQLAEEVAITKTDPRLFLNRLEFAMSGSTNPLVLSGVQADIMENLDVPAISANQQTYNAETKAKETVTKFPFEMTFGQLFTVSPQNLYGIPYLGADATVPQLNLTFANPEGSLAEPAKVQPKITFENGFVEVELWRIDLPGPVAPRVVTEMADGKEIRREIPGQGLYHESSYLLHTRQFDAEDLSAAGTTKHFRLPIGPDYLRIVLLAEKEGALDPETAPLLDRAELSVQRATAIEVKEIWQFEEEYRKLYNKARPKGVYVFSGIDETGTDADLYISRELGDFELTAYGSANAPGADSRFQVVTQDLVPLSSPGQYL
jgi:hypothetical protein